MQQPAFVEQLQSSPGVYSREHLDQFIANPFRADLRDLRRHRSHCRESPRLNLITEGARQSDTTQHAELVFREAVPRLADRADDPSLDILLTADEIQHLVRNRVEKQAVDREIAPFRVMTRI